MKSQRLGPTLGTMANAVLARTPKRAAGLVRPSRQTRFRDYVRKKRHH